MILKKTKIKPIQRTQNGANIKPVSYKHKKGAKKTSLPDTKAMTSAAMSESMWKLSATRAIEFVT